MSYWVGVLGVVTLVVAGGLVLIGAVGGLMFLCTDLVEVDVDDDDSDDD